MKNIIIFLCLCTICMCRLHAADSSRADSLLLKLDQAIKERPIYMEQKELKLVELKRQLHRQIPDEERLPFLAHCWMSTVRSIRILHCTWPRKGNR